MKFWNLVIYGGVMKLIFNVYVFFFYFGYVFVVGWGLWLDVFVFERVFWK